MAEKLSRRTFLKSTPIILGALHFTLTRGDKYLRAPLLPDATPEDDTAFEANIRWLRDYYHLTIERDLGIFDRFFITGEKTEPEELKLSVAIIKREVQKYPPNFFNRNGITSLTLINNLKRNGKKINGVFDANTGAIVIDTALVEVKKSFAHTFHHEVYHACDWHDHEYDRDNQKWTRLHNCDCLVYSGRETSPISPASYVSDPPPASAEEERAEMAERMMMSKSHVELLERIESLKNTEAGQILQAKLNLIKEDYFYFSNGFMDAEYWEALCPK